MVSIESFEKIVYTAHYKRYHEDDVPPSIVVSVLLVGRQKQLKNNLIVFLTESFYVLAKKENNRLKIINAKRR